MCPKCATSKDIMQVSDDDDHVDEYDDDDDDDTKMYKANFNDIRYL